MQYKRPFYVRRTGGSITLTLTEPFRIMGWEIDDTIIVSIDNDKIILEREKT